MAKQTTISCSFCGNEDFHGFKRCRDGYICKYCGRFFSYQTDKDKIEEISKCSIGYDHIRNYHFEDAENTFRGLLRIYPDSIDARWGLLLARFGVVYIRGFFDKEIKPIFCFPDYDDLKHQTFRNQPEFLELKAHLVSDPEAESFYLNAAAEIDRAIENFKRCKGKTDREVFFCVKISKTLENIPTQAGRTADYEDAVKLYEELARNKDASKNRTVFFSAITLKNEIKSDDEIWLNLVKSKKMLLVASDYDYLESPWVKSEWQRWLYLGRRKDLYIYVLRHDHEFPKEVLPRELRECQIYTKDSRKKLLQDLRGEETEPKTSHKTETRSSDDDSRKNEPRPPWRASDWFLKVIMPILMVMFLSASIMMGIMLSSQDGYGTMTTPMETTPPETTTAETTTAETSSPPETTTVQTTPEQTTPEQTTAETTTATETLDPTDEPENKRSWMKRVGQWIVGGLFVACALCCVFVWLWKKRGLAVGLMTLFSVANFFPVWFGYEFYTGGGILAAGALALAGIFETYLFYDDFEDHPFLAAFSAMLAFANVVVAFSVKDGMSPRWWFYFGILCVFAFVVLVIFVYQGYDIEDWGTPVLFLILIGGFLVIHGLLHLLCPQLMADLNATALVETDVPTIPKLTNHARQWVASGFLVLGAIGSFLVWLGKKKWLSVGMLAFFSLSNFLSVWYAYEYYAIGGIVAAAVLAVVCCILAFLNANDWKHFSGGLYGISAMLSFLNLVVAFCAKDGMSPYWWIYCGILAFFALITILVFIFTDNAQYEEWATPVLFAILIGVFLAAHGLLHWLCPNLMASLNAVERSADVETNVSEEKSLEFTLNDDGVSYSVTGAGNMKKEKALVIPSTYNGLPVTGVGNRALVGCKMETLTIPDSIKTFGSRSFARCTNLTSVTIPDSITYMGYETFWSCTSLKTVVFEAGTLHIGTNMFASCTALTDVTLPESLRWIPIGAFGGCRSLKTITIPAKVSSIGENAFSYCSKLENIVFMGTEEQWNLIDKGDLGVDVPVIFEGGKTVAEETSSTEKQTDVLSSPDARDGKVVYRDGRVEVIPYGLVRIEDRAYENNQEIKSIILPESVTSIGVSAFAGSWLEDIVFSDNILRIEAEAFKNCFRLKALDLPDRLVNIGDSAFNGCFGITSLILPDSISYMGQNAFAYCSGIETLSLSANLTSIPYGAFQSCRSLMNVAIPESVLKIDAFAFQFCESLYDIEIPRSVVLMGINAFAFCDNLTNVYIPKEVKTVEYGAFYSCPNLTLTYEGTSAEWSALYRGGGEIPSVICLGDTTAIVPMTNWKWISKERYI